MNCLPSKHHTDALRTWRIGRIAVGVAGLVFSVLYLIEGNNLAFGELRAPGPGVFPMFLGVLFALVSLATIVEAVFTRSPGETAYPVGPDLKRLLSVSGCFVLYVALLLTAGFLASTILFVACFARLVGSVSWVRALIGGAAVALAVWGVFTLVLGVRLPAGIWS